MALCGVVLQNTPSRFRKAWDQQHYCNMNNQTIQFHTQWKLKQRRQVLRKFCVHHTATSNVNIQINVQCRLVIYCVIIIIYLSKISDYTTNNFYSLQRFSLLWLCHVWKMHPMFTIPVEYGPRCRSITYGVHFLSVSYSMNAQ